MSILNILNELASDNSRKHKEAILKREKNNQLLQGVFFHALNPYINYYQKKIPEYTPNKTAHAASLASMINSLKDLSTREVTGNEAIRRLQAILEATSADDALVIERIIGRDMKCGVNESTVNKIWNGLIPTFDVMTCHKDISHIVYPAIAQTKMDAARCHLHFDGKVAKNWARSGKEFKLFGVFSDAAAEIMQANEEIDGEIVFTDKNGKYLDRKTSNGLANKANKGTISEEEASRAVFVAWDVIDRTSTKTYEERFEDLTRRIKNNKGKIRLVKYQMVANVDEANKFYEQERELGEEGAIIKNLKGVWEPKRSKNCGKMKAEEEADLVVVGFKWGKAGSKYENDLGSLECETSDGLLNVNVSGMDEEVRFKYSHPEKWIGKIITVKYNMIIESKNSDKKSLFLPRFIEERFDKDEANLLEELK